MNGFGKLYSLAEGYKRAWPGFLGIAVALFAIGCFLLANAQPVFGIAFVWLGNLGFAAALLAFLLARLSELFLFQTQAQLEAAKGDEYVKSLTKLQADTSISDEPRFDSGAPGSCTNCGRVSFKTSIQGGLCAVCAASPFRSPAPP